MSHSVFIVNFKHPFDLFLVFSFGEFEQVINCCNITFTTLYSNFVTSSSCLSMCTLILSLVLIDVLLNLQKLFCNECFETRYLFFFFFFSCLHFNVILFTSTEFCTIWTQFDVIQGKLKLIFRLHGKNMPNYTRIKSSTLSLWQGWKNHRAKISPRLKIYMKRTP